MFHDTGVTARPRPSAWCVGLLVLVAGAAQKPAYDLTIVRVNDTIRTTRIGEDNYYVFTVELANLGTRPIQQADVRCKVGDIEFLSLAGAGVEAGAEVPFKVQSQDPRIFKLRPGRYLAGCRASIVRPAGASDANPSNDAKSGTVMQEDPGLPDLMVDEVSLRDCETRGPALAGRRACLDVDYRSRSGRLDAAWRVRCTLAVMGGKGWGAPVGTFFAAGIHPMTTQVLGATLPVGTLGAGTYSAACRVDADDAIRETDESNNEATKRFSVTSGAGFRYDIAITKIADRTDPSHVYDGRPVIDVWIKNLGNQAVDQAVVECTMGSERFASLSGAPTYEPGSEKPHAIVADSILGRIAAGRKMITCTASIVTPSHVTETTLANNRRTSVLEIVARHGP